MTVIVVKSIARDVSIGQETYQDDEHPGAQFSSAGYHLAAFDE